MGKAKPRARQKERKQAEIKKASFFQKHGNMLFWCLFGVILLFSFWNVFRGLSIAPLFDWDESRHGVSAWEMLQSGDYLVQTYQGEVDYWNLKPPLSFWPMALGYRLFGVNALGLRFFSALSLPLCCAGAMLLIRRHSGKAAALCTGFLFALTGVQFNHLFLHGDADAVLFLFYFFALLFFYLSYAEKSVFLIGTGIFTACAFLAKAAHAGVLIVVLLLSMLILRREKSFSIIEFGLFFALPMVSPILLWCYFRWKYDGFSFLQQMLFTDIISRTTSELESNARGGTYYLKEFSRALGPLLFVLFICILVACLLILFLNKKSIKKMDKVFICVYSLMAIVPIALYSLAVTKLSWYVWPAFIGFIMLTGWLIGFLLRLHVQANSSKNQGTLEQGVLVIMGLAILLAIGVMPNRFAMQKYYDTSTIFPENCIFLDLPNDMATPSTYIALNTDGSRANLPQSWVLQGIFSGYYQAPDSNGDNGAANPLLLVHYSSASDLEAFQQAHPDYSIFANGKSYVLMSVE
ncbi:glycosyltransferase family 39 protein [Ruminococcaceae bacterium OttesenSCG-928-L11]|nr:glycosyltransferase family 39 protein [Ruminococcaceae bacterium OttesenSCG-928-L11]